MDGELKQARLRLRAGLTRLSHRSGGPGGSQAVPQGPRAGTQAGGLSKPWPLWVLPLLSGSVSCLPQPLPCQSHVHEGDVIRVTVLGPGSADSAELSGLPSCPIDDVAIGDTLDVRIDRRIPTSRTCYHFACPDDFPAPSEPLERSVHDRLANALCMRADRKVQIAKGCEAGRFVALYLPVPTDDVYAQPADDESTAVQLVRALALPPGSEGLSCQEPPAWLDLAEAERKSLFCADVWHVQLARSG